MFGSGCPLRRVRIFALVAGSSAPVVGDRDVIVRRVAARHHGVGTIAWLPLVLRGERRWSVSENVARMLLTTADLDLCDLVLSYLSFGAPHGDAQLASIDCARSPRWHTAPALSAD